MKTVEFKTELPIITTFHIESMEVLTEFFESLQSGKLTLDKLRTIPLQVPRVELYMNEAKQAICYKEYTSGYGNHVSESECVLLKVDQILAYNQNKVCYILTPNQRAFKNFPSELLVNVIVG